MHCNHTYLAIIVAINLILLVYLYPFNTTDVLYTLLAFHFAAKKKLFVDKSCNYISRICMEHNYSQHIAMCNSHYHNGSPINVTPVHSYCSAGELCMFKYCSRLVHRNGMVARW